jgi:hypothetical protein
VKRLYYSSGKAKRMSTSNRYEQIIEKIFFAHYAKGMKVINFSRPEIEKAAKSLGLERVKNFGDLIYSFRYRVPLPEKVIRTAPLGLEWIIRPAGKAKYSFSLVKFKEIKPSTLVPVTQVPDSTPGLIEKYRLSDEQALLAIVRYNRLIDIFTGTTCYSLQNHLRSTVKGMGQVETDEIYVGVDKGGVQYVFPVQAKGGKDKLGVIQVEQDIALCGEKFPALVCRPIGAQFMEDNLIALFQFGFENGEIIAPQERHYRLVPPEEVTPEMLKRYVDRENVKPTKGKARSARE